MYIGFRVKLNGPPSTSTRAARHGTAGVRTFTKCSWAQYASAPPAAMSAKPTHPGHPRRQGTALAARIASPNRSAVNGMNGAGTNTLATSSFSDSSAICPA